MPMRDVFDKDHAGHVWQTAVATNFAKCNGVFFDRADFAPGAGNIP